MKIKIQLTDGNTYYGHCLSVDNNFVYLYPDITTSFPYMRFPKIEIWKIEIV